MAQDEHFDLPGSPLRDVAFGSGKCALGSGKCAFGEHAAWQACDSNQDRSCWERGIVF